MKNYFKKIDDFYTQRKKVISETIETKKNIDKLKENSIIIKEQNIELDTLVSEFNNNQTNNKIILEKEKNTNSDFLKIFNKPELINNLTIEVPNFFYNEKETTNFLIIFYYKNISINKFIIPFNNCGKYIEKIIFNKNTNETKSIFSCKRNSDIKCFYRGNIINNNEIIKELDKNNNIVFNNLHSYDSINVQYEPLHNSYFINLDYTIVDSIKIKTTNDISKIIVNF